MELLTNIEKTLLDEALESLHQQSVDWLSQLELWQDERSFFEDLIGNKLFQTSIIDQKVISDILNKADGTETTALFRDIRDHEKALEKILLGDKGSEQNYREKHRQLRERISSLQEKVKLIKKAVYELTKIVNANFFNKNETLHIIQSRRAVRKYKQEPVDRTLVSQVLNAAIMAPSALNLQPWKFYVLTNREKIKRYSKEAAKAAEAAYHDLVKDLLKAKDPIFHGAPVVIFITGIKASEWAPLDIGFCAQNLMLAAKSLGLDTCPVGLGRFIEASPVYKELLIPETEKIQLAVVLGYGDETPVQHERKTDKVVFLT